MTTKTTTKPFRESPQQNLPDASGQYAIPVSFQTVDAAGKDGMIREKLQFMP
jgi:polyphosphate kinase 2 (PPK2 family)